MATQDLEKRVENIEETLRELATVPARLGGLEGQVGGLVHQVGRLEGQVGSLGGRVGGLETQFLQSREEVRLEFSAVHGELHELRDGQERLGSQMRMLYEDLVERIKRLGEGGTFLGGRS